MSVKHDIENAQRWVARCEDDENSCAPCKNNGGRLYRNRQAAYRDYPGGRGYVKCEGRANCRCTVVKRGGENRMNRDQLPVMIERARTLSNAVSARTLAESARHQRPGWFAATLAGPPPAEAFRMAAKPTGEGATLYLYDAIGGWDGIQAMDVVRALAGVTGPLDVHVNSYGGVIFEGAAIYNALDAYEGPITGYVDGVAASAASFILMACDEIETAKNGTMMIHDGSGICMGTADDMRDLADLLDMLSDTIAETYAARAGGKAQDWRNIMREGDKWYNAAGMLEAKLVDRIRGVADGGEDGKAGDGTNTGNAWDGKALLSLFTLDAPTDTTQDTGDTITPVALSEDVKVWNADELRAALVLR